MVGAFLGGLVTCWLVVSLELDVLRRGAHGWLDRTGTLVVAALGVDQLREPPDLTLDRLHTVALELHGVAVHLLLGLLQLVLHPVEPLLEAGAPPLEDAEP